MSLDRSHLVNRRLTVAFVLQVVGYAALLAVYPHSEPSAVAEALQVLPTPLLVVVALPALPALALTLAVGAVLSAVGAAPESVPALLLARGDVLFFVCAYVVAVASAPLSRRAAELTD
ncbi:hypothetical protein HWV07_05300 [Natronomonas salina]|uniref:hypothetical protein n=1 Tax=Natronomonas salina TaxID=1710540 RepID=UPI0015B6579F|nr:hypothetical protein [Natronomonas salina]QLD88479.1 hypothetical protein HWV07_05300 [Natronomonas salina]